jgi:cysteine desulfurase
VGRIEGNFHSETPLHPKARAVFLEAIDQGWSDPKKLTHQSAKARILKDQALESLAHHLSLRPTELEIIGEPLLGNYFAIQGLLRDDDTFMYSAADRKEVFAIAQSRSNKLELPVTIAGQIPTDALHNSRTSLNAVFALQIANGETGVVQHVEELLDVVGPARIACDFSSCGPRISFPPRWDTAFFDAKAWQGPEGIAIVAIAEGAPWANPLPHIGNARTPQSASLPLMLAAAVALEVWHGEEKTESPRLRDLSERLRREISSTVADCDIAGDLDSSLPHITSLSFLYIEGEELLRKLDTAGFAVDSGSACTAENLQPSHVLAAMGVLTHGNIRITLHHGITEKEVNNLIAAIITAVAELRQ